MSSYLLNPLSELYTTLSKTQSGASFSIQWSDDRKGQYSQSTAEEHVQHGQLDVYIWLYDIGML